MTLARQMYPENSQKFMNVFNKATHIPFGYLLVDLKPTTYDSDRLRPNILENIGEYKLQINRGELHLPDHLSFYQQQERIERSNCDEIDTKRPMTLYCIDCGILFASAKDLQQHAKRGCPEVHARDMDHLMKRCKYENNSDTNYDSEEERRAKSRRWITLECDGSNQISSDESDIDEDEKGFEELIQKAYDKYNDLYQEKKKELMATMDEAHAEKEAYDMLRLKYKKNIIKDYKFFLYLTDILKNSPTHQAITDDINEHDLDEYVYDDVVDKVIKDNSYLFDELLEQFNEDPHLTSLRVNTNMPLTNN